MNIRRLVALPALAAAFTFMGGQAWAQAFSAGDQRSSSRAAEVVPLREVFSTLKSRYGGYQLDAELFSTSSGGMEYRIEWMSGEGRRMRITVDALSGRIIRASGA